MREIIGLFENHLPKFGTKYHSKWLELKHNALTNKVFWDVVKWLEFVIMNPLLSSIENSTVDTW